MHPLSVVPDIPGNTFGATPATIELRSAIVGIY
jgi:hypothetical protein